MRRVTGILMLLLFAAQAGLALQGSFAHSKPSAMLEWRAADGNDRPLASAHCCKDGLAKTQSGNGACAADCTVAIAAAGEAPDQARERHERLSDFAGRTRFSGAVFRPPIG